MTERSETSAAAIITVEQQQYVMLNLVSYTEEAAEQLKLMVLAEVAQGQPAVCSKTFHVVCTSYDFRCNLCISIYQEQTWRASPALKSLHHWS